MDVSLCRLHSQKPSFVHPHDSGLIRDRELRADHERKLLSDQLARDTGECRVRHFLDADPGVQETANLQVVVLLVFDVDISDLGASALVCETLFVGPRVTRQRIQCPLDFEKHLLLGQPPRLHSRGLECGLGARHQALKLR